MEAAPAAAAAATAALLGKREPSLDPVKAQGILSSLTAKERTAAQEWEKTWSFYRGARDAMEQEALALGLSREQYRSALQKLSCEPAPAQYPVRVDPSPAPLPLTSNGMVGRRASCPLERYGRLAQSARDYPLHPPRPPGQVYDPYKQTFIFLGIDCGDPISYRMSARGGDVPAAAWGEPRRPHVAPLSRDTLLRARRQYNIS